MSGFSGRLCTALTLRCPYIGDAAKVTLLLLHDLAGRDPYPVQKELAAIRDKAMSNFQRDIAELKAANFVELVHDGPRMRVLAYKVNYAALMDAMGVPKNEQRLILKGDVAATKKVLAEIRGRSEIEKAKKIALAGRVFQPKSPYKDYTQKPAKQYTAEDLGDYFRDRYQERMKVAYPVLGQHEREGLRKLLKAHKAPLCVKMIGAFLANWRRLDDVRGPSIPVLCRHQQNVLLIMSGNYKGKVTDGFTVTAKYTEADA